MARKPGRMAAKGKRTFDRTDAELADQELQLLMDTDIDWDSLRPEVSDQEAYDELIAAVKEATAQNENIAQLKERLTSLGEGGVALIKKVVRLIP